MVRFPTPAFECAAGCGGDLQDSGQCFWSARRTRGVCVGDRQGDTDEKLGHGRAARCLRAPMTAVNRLEIRLCINLK